MEDKRSELAKPWFEKAEQDKCGAEDILESRHGFANTVCFLSQQMAEKYLKGFLVYKGKEFPKIHQIDRLVRLCGDADKDFNKLKKDAEFLSAFYVATRYPGDFPDFAWKDAKKAFAAAQKIKKMVLRRIKK